VSLCMCVFLCDVYVHDVCVVVWLVCACMGVCGTHGVTMCIHGAVWLVCVYSLCDQCGVPVYVSVWGAREVPGGTGDLRKDPS
jgi:hypothetical protein